MALLLVAVDLTTLEVAAADVATEVETVAARTDAEAESCAGAPPQLAGIH